MKCTSDIFASQINKACLSLRYKFLLHVLVQCLSKSRARYDMAGNDLVGLMVALVLNKPFSISKFIYANMKENLRRTRSRTSGNKFLMYPRFMQMIMNNQHPGLPKVDNDILKIDAMFEQSLRIFKGFAAKRYTESDPPRKMFGALKNTQYVPPANDKWRHDDSQSDDKEPKLKKMMEDKFGRKELDSSESESDGDDGGDAAATTASAPGDTGASAAGTTGASSTGDDPEESESDDNQPEPGYEFYLDERGVRKVRRIRQEDDADYVPSDTEVERLKRKQTAPRRKKQARKYIDTSSVQPSVPQQKPTHEAEMNPEFGLTAEEASAIVSSPPRSTEPPPAVTSAAETPTVTPQEPSRTLASTIRATTSQQASERRIRKFSEMQHDEKVEFLFSQLQTAAGQINRQSELMNATRSDVIKQQLESNTLKSTVQRQQAEITRQQAEIELLKAENARLKDADEERERQLQQM
ncbi:hypothetical protein HanRHA438_Chr13g0612821 [Helianthus annuus]|uniref:Uncharacterized protein n=1 Tax=Helianthus annuus TaxID=4232 RepID=A0A9K3EIT2_HELAN|nr:hypothetical protein HanXRQr2_Chr13g0602541 [Helianthus annuus]KAJ0477929.1 hypothetical protein HanHA300_Chr13g0494451 [Helianthus annuus]KAJ0498759.1 hypothetical protein HanHA89_Chr13g0526571 [Helianthus annuus]KAJ0664779.1 hypothetical protein HanLR1_Chr13g0496641 [Helianthus annuus]KAJ0672219.1 hypothetical protein HanOQP8_Chr13g0494811 [Helianthus annuus]